MARRLLVVLALGLLGCRRTSSSAPADTKPSLADEVLPLIAQGDADGALARLRAGDQADGEVLYLEGLAWARKAEGAPAPGDPSVLKPEEEKALALLERAVAVRPELAAAHTAIADLLAPHALRREAAVRALASGRARGAAGRRKDEPSAPAPVDSGVDRVLQAYRRGAQADPVSKSIVEAWIDFARRAGRLEEADAGFKQLLLRDKENAAPFVRYGDFLVEERKDEMGAINAYSQALIWQPKLEDARAKIADIYLAQSSAHFDRKEYSTAQARLADARRYVSSPASPQGVRLRQLQSQLGQIRSR
jgi:tetratricopeptide (TPR) repeat protein